MSVEQTIEFCRNAIATLAPLSGNSYGQKWCELKMEFLRLYHPQLVFSTRFGSDFFIEIEQLLVTRTLLRGNDLGWYDKNLNIWLSKLFAA